MATLPDEIEISEPAARVLHLATIVHHRSDSIDILAGNPADCIAFHVTFFFVELADGLVVVAESAGNDGRFTLFIRIENRYRE